MKDAVAKIHRGAGRVAFLARLETFKEMLTAGHPLKAIYDEHKQHLGIGYPQFTRYVNRYLGSNKVDEPRKQENSPKAIESTKRENNSKKTKPGGFEHDATSGNKRNDLI